MQAALSLLKESGAEGLTMRKVALVSGRSLNNVQHHFTNKSKLLESLANYYFSVCDDIIEQYVNDPVQQDPKAALHDMIRYSLEHADHISDACLVFRELWAISTRNQDVENQLVKYYSYTLNRICNYWADYDIGNAKKAASILLPFIDGYSIQHKAIPISKEEISCVLAESLYAILSSPAD